MYQGSAADVDIVLTKGMQGRLFFLPADKPPKAIEVIPPMESNEAPAEQRDTTVEMFTDRVGGDYRNFEVKADDRGEVCRAACDGDKQCRAWTYVRAGYIGAAPRCFLKSEIKPPRRKPCCISGVVR